MSGLPFRAVHQLVSNFDVGDAIGNHVRALRKLLRTWGYASEVYAQYRHMSLLKDAHFYTTYRAVSSPDTAVLFHFSIGSEVTSFFAGLRDRRAMVYHNITPPEYFVGVNARVADRCRRGRFELARLRSVTELALGVSEFNRQELASVGFRRTGVLPILVDWEQYRHPPVAALEDAYGRGTNLLAVGRLAPNKRVEDLIKAYYFYRRLDPDSRLIVVGSAVDTEAYLAGCQKLCAELGLLDHVVFAGSVSQQELCTYYRLASAYLCLSEHEGFCVPLLEAMHFDVPVIAYAAAGVPGTMGEAGLLLQEKDFPAIAELAHRAVHDPALRASVVAGQRARLRAFDAEAIGATLREHLETLAGAEALRLAFVVQRYGPEIDGGAEYECRRVAEALAAYHDVEVLTTCARDYLTWRNVYAPGVTTLNGVRVRRFPVDRPRRVRAFGRYADWLYATPHTFFDEAEWVRRQGPLAPALVEWIRAHAEDHDGFVYYTYLYLPTTLGLPLVAHKAVLVPTAHDERPIYLDLFRSLFRLPRGLIFQVEEERAFVEARFHTAHIPAAVIGAGIDPVTDADGARFRRQHGLDGPYFLYVGRVDVEKGCRGLVDAFLAWRQRAAEPATLVLMGTVALKLPRHPAVRALGFRPEPEKHDALAGATALVMPSPHESFSFVVLEAWSQGTPVLATARSPVLRGHVERSGAGLLYDRTARDFDAAAGALLADEALRKSLGERGRAYVEARYRWPGITRQYLAFLARVFGEGAA